MRGTGLKGAMAVALTMTLLVAAALPPATAPQRINEQQLIGAWRLVDSALVMPDGRTFPNPVYGAHPHGYLIYDPSHTMCVFLAVGDPTPPLPAELHWPDHRAPSTYCGRWSLDPAGGAVIHDIEVTPPDEKIAGKQVRRATLEGDTLIIRSHLPAGLKDYFLRFERVRGAPAQP